MKKSLSSTLGISLAGLLFFFLNPDHGYAQTVQDWATVKDHVIQIDTEGWSFPVEILFVPQPGKNPKDPLYYVTELRGTIKVVTNDRTILTYAENVNNYEPPTELPSTKAELGLAGLCLDPVHGYLFATTIYFKNSLIYNKIVRFEHATAEFALKPEKVVSFTKIFEQDESGISHQIGKCVIGTDHKLYVGVGDGQIAYKAQELTSPNGKILRMNLDFSAPQDNPFYNPANPEFVTSYIYAYGLRNPFAIALDEINTVYNACNGPNKDRLIEVVPGKNYLWDGTDESMRSDSLWLWSGSVGPAGLIYLGSKTIFPYWRERLIVAQGGTIGELGPSTNGKVTLNSFKVKKGKGLQTKPETLVWFRGNYQQLLVPIVEGPDGLYFSGFFPDPSGKTTILKLRRQEGAVSGQETLTGAQLYRAKSCDGCHQINGIGGKVGPPLDGIVDHLKQRLAQDSYLKQLEEVDALAIAPFNQYQEARQKIRQLDGEAKIEFWIKHHLVEPRFDLAQSQMPNLQLSAEEVSQITAYLMTLRNTVPPKLSFFKDLHRQFRIWWDTDYKARPLVAFILGLLLAPGLYKGSHKLLRIIMRKGG